MPSKNVIKIYRAGGIYHIYNRGVEKRKIFIDEKDRKVFEKYLNEKLTKFKIILLNKALPNNHFHLLVKQKNKRGIERLMRSVGTRYTLYFNFKYERVGRLFQGIYKARLVETERDLIDTSRYIDKNREDDLG